MPNVPGFALEISAAPLRKINTRGRVRPTGRFASRKMGCCLPWESSLELAWLQRAELDPEVEAFYAQPLAIEISVGGRVRSYVPDGVAIRRGRVEVHEAKPDADAADDEVRALAEAALRHLALQGALYGFALESVLKAHPVYANMQDVLRRLHRRVPEVRARRIVEAAQDAAGPLPAAVLARSAASQGGTFEDVLALVAGGRLRMELARLVNADAPVWAAEAFPDPAPILPPPVMPERS